LRLTAVLGGVALALTLCAAAYPDNDGDGDGLTASGQHVSGSTAAGWHEVITDDGSTATLGSTAGESQTSKRMAHPGSSDASPEDSANVAQTPTSQPVQIANCPAGSRHTGSLLAYSCLYMVKDLNGHWNKLRNGKTGSVASGGFGLIHAEVDHGYTQPMIEFTIANSHVQPQGNHKYYFEWTHYDSNGLRNQDIRVVQNRNTTNGSGDGFELGLQTAYCLKEPGSVEEAQCPAWVQNDF
jgi:hypothetical protein